MSRRFDYVAYDKESEDIQMAFKSRFGELEDFTDKALKDSRAKSLFMTALEEAYMWTGKAIRDAQIERLPNTPDVPARSNE